MRVRITLVVDARTLPDAIASVSYDVVTGAARNDILQISATPES